MASKAWQHSMDAQSVKTKARRYRPRSPWRKIRQRLKRPNSRLSSQSPLPPLANPSSLTSILTAATTIPQQRKLNNRTPLQVEESISTHCSQEVRPVVVQALKLLKTSIYSISILLHSKTRLTRLPLAWTLTSLRREQIHSAWWIKCHSNSLNSNKIRTTSRPSSLTPWATSKNRRKCTWPSRIKWCRWWQQICSNSSTLTWWCSSNRIWAVRIPSLPCRASSRMPSWRINQEWWGNNSPTMLSKHSRHNSNLIIWDNSTQQINSNNSQEVDSNRCLRIHLQIFETEIRLLHQYAKGRWLSCGSPVSCLLFAFLKR